MPIEHLPVIAIDQPAFKKIDYIVMGLAYETHNEIGRHFDEAIFKNSLITKLAKGDLEISLESPIKLTHQNYEKTFFVDLIVNRSVPYEFKVSKDFHPKHIAQLLQYLHLLDLRHGKLINSGKKSVEGRFVSTNFTQLKRKKFRIDTHEMDRDAECLEVLNSFEGLLYDWGTSLETCTYLDALTAILPSASKDRVDIYFNQAKVGSVELTRISPRTALTLTAFSQSANGYRKHLANILSLSTLERILWINMNKQNIQISTLQA